jgi:hypothetical protein
LVFKHVWNFLRKRNNRNTCGWKFRKEGSRVGTTQTKLTATGMRQAAGWAKVAAAVVQGRVHAAVQARVVVVAVVGTVGAKVAAAVGWVGLLGSLLLLLHLAVAVVLPPAAVGQLPLQLTSDGPVASL